MVEKISVQSLGDASADKRLHVLRHVAQCGSISQAARAAGISYKAAWQALHTLSALAGQPVVAGSAGGAGGGGARLTDAGQRLLQAADLMAQARRSVLAHVNAPERGLPAAQAALAQHDLWPLGAPRTSMRNLLRCTVCALHQASGRDTLVQAELALPEGARLLADITRESAELLALAPGLPVLAMCKAAAVHITAHADAAQAAAPAANALHGRVAHITRGGTRDEVTLLADGLPLTGFAARPNRLRTGSRASAWLDSSAVAIALPQPLA